jgi:hypothetical protein
MRPMMIVHNPAVDFDSNGQLKNGATRQMDILLQGDWNA